MTKDEALRLALEALEDIGDEWGFTSQRTVPKRKEAITAIKEALAQPEQPKVRTGDCLLVGVCASEGHKIAPQRTWAGLTDEEIEHAFKTNSVMVDNGNAYMVAGLRAVNIARAIEAKLKEKNGL
jgi:hypothetical protein